MNGVEPDSSAGGEQPKFCCLDTQGRSWIVKFSPAEANPVAERIRTLLRCEHLALETLGAAGQPVARTQLHEVQGRVFLAAERFDRPEPDLLGRAPGRIGMVSLESFNAEFAGPVDQWARTAQRLHDQGLLSAAEARRLKLWDAFGSSLPIQTGITAMCLCCGMAGAGSWRLAMTCCPCALCRCRVKCQRGYGIWRPYSRLRRSCLCGRRPRCSRVSSGHEHRRWWSAEAAAYFTTG